MSKKLIKKLNTKEFEKPGILRNIFYSFFIHPILNVLSLHHQSQVKKSHKLANDVIEYKTSHKALEIIYTSKYSSFSKSLSEKLFYHIWMNTNNARGLRNRLSITENCIEEHIRFFYAKGERDLQLLSIASGSARSFLEVLQRLKGLHNLKIHITFLDKSNSALEYSKGLFSDFDTGEIKCTFKWIQDTANNFLRNLPEGQNYHLVEMVGLMDYFDDKKAGDVSKAVHNKLKSNGCFVTANIISNKEKTFMSNIVDWKMIYRKPVDFLNIILKTDFSQNNTIAYVEPMGVHVIIKAIKDDYSN